MLYDIILPEPSTSFYVSCDLWPCHLMWPAVWQCDLVTSNPNPDSKNRIKENKSKRKSNKKRKMKNIKSTSFVLDIQELREFFSKDTRNHIKFWDCPSKQKWLLHYSVDKDTKIMVSTLPFPCKSSWDFYRKTQCNSILSQQRMLFQAADSKGKNFLDLLDDNLNPIKPSSIKGGPWL